MRNYIFISYAHKDSERVLPVIKKLRESGYNVWYDDGIDPGTEWAVNIATHIEGCAYFLAFMSQAYLDSLNCREEWNFARDEQKTRFFVYIEDVTLPSEMRMRSSMIQNLFMHRYNDKEEFYSKLFAAPGIGVCKKAVPERETEKEETVADEAVSELERVEEQPEDEVVDEAVIEPECVGEQTEEVKTIEECEETTETVEEEDKAKPEEAEIREESSELLLKEVTAESDDILLQLIDEILNEEEVESECVESQPKEIGEIEEREETQEAVKDENESEAEVIKSFRNIFYTDDGETVTIAGCMEYARNLTIPEEIKGMPVVVIRAHAFEGNATLVTITIPKNVLEIGESAFKDCACLTEVTGIDRVREIAPDAFDGCIKLKKNPLQREEWEEYFEIEESEKGITICKCIKDAEEIVIPEMINGKKVIRIGSEAFGGCTSLSGIEIPVSVTEIGYAAFEGCRNLLTVSIPRKVRRIDFHAFSRCTSLSSVEIPKSVIEMGNMVFSGCTNLQSVMLPKLLVGLDDYLLVDCKKLKSIVIPENVKYIGSDIFYGCEGLRRIKYSGKNKFVQVDKKTRNPSWEEYRKAREIPDDVTIIASDAFMHCTGLFLEDLDEITCEMLVAGGCEDAKARLRDIYLEHARMYSEGDGVEKDEKIAAVYYQKAADYGSVVVQYKLAEIYMEGKYIEKNVEKAIGYYQKAAVYGDADALYKLAKMYMEGKYVEKDEKKAGVLFEKAAKNGNADAQCIMADMYMEGRRVEKNRDKALELYRSAAQKGSVDAKYELICCHLKGEEVGLDKKKLGEMYCDVIEKEELLRKLQIHIPFWGWKKQLICRDDLIYWNMEAAEKGNAYAQYETGCYWEKNNDLQKAIMWFEKAANQGDESAKNGLARLYEKNGDIHTAIRWYEEELVGCKKREREILQKGDDKGRLKGLNELTEAFFSSDAKHLHLAELYVTIKDWANAVRHYRNVADNNNVDAQCKMAFYALDGKGMQKDLSEAVKWYQKAANNKSTIAEFCLAMLCLTGRGVEQNVEIAFTLFQRVAEQGHSIACLMLALMYGTGRGVAKNDDMAKQWCEKASERGIWDINDIPYENSKQYRSSEINEWVNRIFRPVDVLQDDLVLAIEWHYDSATENNAVVYCNLGYLHEKGWGVSKDREKAMEWYQKAVELGDPNAEELLKRCKKSNGLGKFFGFFS